MSLPTPGERDFAVRMRLEPEAVARARIVLNTIAFLPWPEPERVALLARLARQASADVGEVLGRLALRAAPLQSFDQLLPIDGLAEKRVRGLAVALADVDASSISQEGKGIADVWALTAGLREENAALRIELDKLYAAGAGGAGPQGPVMLVRDVANSVATQTAAAAEQLRQGARGLQLANLELRIECGAAAIAEEVALDLAAPGRGSALNLSFTSASGPAPRPEVEVPDVRGYSLALARRKLTARGLALVVSAMAGAEGVVSSQKPDAGDLVPEGSLVRLVVR